jgi:hypothetical protein
LTSITTLGGKKTRSAAPWTILETGQAFIKEPFSPFADNLPRQIETFTNLFILETV